MAPEGPRALAVLVVHGMGDQSPDWAKDWIERLNRTLQEEGRTIFPASFLTAPVAVIEAMEAFWADILQVRQKVLSSILQEDADRFAVRSGWPRRLWRKLAAFIRRRERRFTTEFLGDVIGYRDPAAYAAIHAALERQLERLAQRAGATPGRPVPLSVVAHSLGSVVFSDYVWDRTLKAQAGPEALHPSLSLQNFFTVGSPLALFSLRYGTPEAFNRPIAVAHPRGLWVNVFDRDDPVGMPLKPLNAAYAKAVFADVRVDAGLPWLSHGGYFKRPETYRIIARKLLIEWAAHNRLLDEKGLGELDEAYVRFLRRDGAAA